MGFLDAIERGEVVLAPAVSPQHVFAGNVQYRASNGWSITVFNDANEWDYIDGIEATGGRMVDFGELEDMPRVRTYEPTREAAWKRYRIPGHLTFRCERCEREVRAHDDTGRVTEASGTLCMHCGGRCPPKRDDGS
jgi:hypothetical protein